MSMQLLKTSILALASCLLVALLSGCTTYTWEDGSKETVFGVPAEDERLTEEERRAQGVRYREPGEIPE
ncbi:hypothetical protein [Halomonas sp. G11]|jgi:outer membrane protein assembly factor BamE (lipoprotein component of BamABCDE complex)|uniref:hypothetical protein n=1 Tax=Halomonas sp. G11 TaxID=1684425 RepID=UPI000A703831|nr:hypothetical protein [Halomonas sp. G11]